MRGVFGHYLPPEGIGNLHKYAYVSGHRTPFDRLMNPWWEAAERVVPRTIHPNALTVSSCITAIIGCSLLLCFCPYLAEHPPRWVFLVSAALFFLYQTLDAIDGKHARRHRLSSPLGQLMDHGCDIICTTPLTLLGTAIIGGGVGLRQYAVLVVSSQLIQFLYTWWELHFGVFYTATGIIGVTEAQLTIILLSIIGGTFGPEVYHVNLLQYLPLSVGAPLAKLAAAAGVDVTPSVLFQLLLLACNISICILNIVMGLKRAPRFCVAFTQVVMFLVYIFFQGLVYMHGLVWRPVLNPYLIYTAICSTYAILLLRLCLSATCRFPYKLVQWPMLPLAAVAAALLLGDLTADQELWAILAVCIFNCIYLADFVYTVVSDVCDGLNTRCFSVPKLGTAQTPSEQPKKAD
ncbi:ethanolaminephosphotransferase, putative [Eimeria necatrix]|uniref:Ethanolaminephosphotransferase, putative n=1 Tax=Eimeria necatrix TaxID=51315 RepID=U6MZQ0_9EIME|nr:ethanolaminephosphotransferase, putative [Eimeria necatrix]CDJ67160.1 ethanolaminephosphotransferase, putative [Eimeria necatrix]